MASIISVSVHLFLIQIFTVISDKWGRWLFYMRLTFSFLFAEETHWLLSDVMNHCQEFHPDLECGPSTQLGSANYFREVLGTHLHSFPALLLSVAMTGSWVAEDPKLGKVVVQYYPRSDDVPTEDKPGIMTIEMPWARSPVADQS